MTELIGESLVLRLTEEGPPIGRASATDLVGEALSADAAVVALPVARLDPDFFRLSTGVAGEIAQKLVNYRLRLAILGDIAAHLDRSPALRDWVRESNRGRELLFVDSWAELEERLRHID